LLNLIGCIDTPSSGKIFINDEDVSGRTPDQLADLRARTIGFIFQTFNLLPVLSAAENVEYPLLHRREMSRQRSGGSAWRIFSMSSVCRNTRSIVPTS
jgi:putative ABC transport system ATP-binding protein